MEIRFRWVCLIALLCYAISSHAHETTASIENSDPDQHSAGQVPRSFASVREVAKKCYEGTKESWGDSVKELIVDPYKYMVHASPEMTKRYLMQCNEHVECRSRLYYEAHGTYDGGAFEPMTFTQIDVLNRAAISRMNSTYLANQRTQQDVDNRKWVEGKSTNLQVAMNADQNHTAFWENLYAQVKQQTGKAIADPKVLCYDLAQIIDPTMAAGLLSKIPKGVKLISGSEKLALTAEKVDIVAEKAADGYGKVGQTEMLGKVYKAGIKAASPGEASFVADTFVPLLGDFNSDTQFANPSKYLSDSPLFPGQYKDKRLQQRRDPAGQ